MTPLPLEEVRELLGVEADGLTDEQVLRIRDDFQRAAADLLPAIERLYAAHRQREAAKQ